MINEGSWGRACILTLDCTGASGRTLVSDGFGAALRLLLLHGKESTCKLHATAVISDAKLRSGVTKHLRHNRRARACDLTLQGLAGDVVFLIQVLAGKRLIANFPEVSTARRCVWRTSDRPSDCWCGPAQGYFQPSFITSFQHQLQNSGEKIDGWRGLVNMRDRNDTRGVPFGGGAVVVARVTAQKMKRQAVGFSGSTLIPIKLILTCKHFCAYSN